MFYTLFAFIRFHMLLLIVLLTESYLCVYLYLCIWTKGHVIVTHHIGLGQTNCGSGDLLAEVGVWE